MCPAEDPAAEHDVATQPTVLVVEDEVLPRLTMADHLRACGFNVVEAANGAEAQALLQGGLEVDLVFSDITMPGGVDGIDLAVWLTVNNPDVRVVVTSGLPDSLKKAQVACDKISDFIPKPYDYDRVATRLREVLAAS